MYLLSDRNTCKSKDDYVTAHVGKTQKPWGHGVQHCHAHSHSHSQQRATPLQQLHHQIQTFELSRDCPTVVSSLHRLSISSSSGLQTLQTMNKAIDFVMLVCMWVVCTLRAFIRGAVEGSAVGVEDFCANFVAYLREYQQCDRAAGTLVRDSRRSVCLLTSNAKKHVLTFISSSKSAPK
jgi:hypothetical protein